MNKLIFCGIVFVFVLLLGCNNNKHSTLPSFYYWKSTLHFSDLEKNTLQQLNTKRLYIKYFDIKWDNATQTAIPVAKIQFDEKITKLEVVPVVFITNESLLKTPDDAIQSLSNHIGTLIKSINDFNQVQVAELQIDCDWTTSTKNKYFALLKTLKSQFPSLPLSCTIRLHQVKYPKITGIPPVDKGMLMFYNMGQIGSISKNSIYDPENAQLYIRSIKQYPLLLDVALPIFGWAIHFQNNKVKHLISKPNVSDFENAVYFHPIQNGVFRVKKSLFLNGYYLKENDEIKLEIITPELCNLASKQLTTWLKSPPQNLVFYDLDSTNLQYFDNEKFNQIISNFD